MRHTRFSGRGLALTIGAAVGACALASTTLATTATADEARATAEEAVADAIPDTAFVTPDELPAHEWGWYAGGPGEGRPEVPVFCFGALLPDAYDGTTAHQEYWTELDATATQVVVDLGDENEAAGLVEVLHEAGTDCASDWLWQNPGGTASWDEFGELADADYGRIFGVWTAPVEAGYDVNLFAVIQDGSKVTVVRWGQMGTLSQAPVAEFRETAEAALDRLND
ncbi:hypothetical protein [Streptomyces profundus]|uniref:hypothetical protein n=1 Tax=Streptomyces profundus TaxID=2867410 RepID=UPI001D15E880|nr:hypothetical protein [Streptomyces sp. MA3_2.13]UED83403.1 hypothetical protein K4G22_03605 [Streptomyces sp. MA3_2.13]